MEVGVELELGLELRLPAAAPMHVGEAIPKSFIKPVHNSSIRKSVHNSFMTAVSVL